LKDGGRKEGRKKERKVKKVEADLMKEEKRKKV